MRIIFLLLMGMGLSACADMAGGPVYGDAPNTNAGAPTRATTKADWRPLAKGSDLSYNAAYKYHPREMKLSNDALLRGSKWNEYLKAYVESFPLDRRSDILDGITRHYHGYDKVEGYIRFEPLRYLSGPYASNSYIALAGRLEPDKATAWARVQYRSDSWLFAESIKVAIDGETYELSDLQFDRDNYTEVWEYTRLPLSNPTYRGLVEKIIKSEEAIIRFRGRQYYSDLVVTGRMKTDMKAMLGAIDAVNSSDE